MDQKDILKYYNENLVFEMNQQQAIKQGYLCKLNYMGFKDNIDYSNIYFNGFKYDTKDLNKNLMIDLRDQAIINKFKEIVKNKKTIGFCASIDHSKWMSEKFVNAGFDAISIHQK